MTEANRNRTSFMQEPSERILECAERVRGLSAEKTDRFVRGLFKSGGERSPNQIRDWVAIFCWRAVQNTIFRFSFHTWHGWRRFLLRVFGADVGRGCIIRRTAEIWYPWKLSLGDGCVVSDRVLVYNLGEVRIGVHAIVSLGARLCAGTHDYTSSRMPLVTRPIIVEAGAWICAEAFVGPGVTVGALSVLGARAVAFEDVPAGMVCAGNPFRVIKARVITIAPETSNHGTTEL